MRARVLIRLGSWLPLAVLLSGYFFYFFEKQVQPVSLENGRLSIADFAYHLTMFRAFWFEDARAIYSPATQLRVLQQHFSPQVNEAMPLGVSPVAFLLSFPLAALDGWALPMGLWVGTSLAVFIAGATQSIVSAPNRLARLSIFVTFILSSCGLTGLRLGQSSFLAAGLLCLLLNHCRNAARPSLIFTVSVLTVLAIKPPYALIAVGALLARRKFSAVLLSAALCAAAFAVVSGGTDAPDLFGDYIESLSIYASGDLPAVYRSSIVYSTMNIFSTSFESFLGREPAFVISNLLFLSTTGMLFLFAIFLATRQSDAFRTVFLLTAAYLLFAPYAGAYEDLLLWPMIAAVWHTSPIIDRSTHRESREAVVVICFLIVLLQQRLLPKEILAVPLWLLKAVFVGYLWNLMRLRIQTAALQQTG